MHEIFTRPLKIRFSLRGFLAISLVVVFGVTTAVEHQFLRIAQGERNVAEQRLKETEWRNEENLRQAIAAEAERKDAFSRLAKEQVRRWQGEQERARLRQQLERLGAPIPQEPHYGMMGSPAPPDSFDVADRLARKMLTKSSLASEGKLAPSERAMIDLVREWIAGVKLDGQAAIASAKHVHEFCDFFEAMFGIGAPDWWQNALVERFGKETFGKSPSRSTWSDSPSDKATVQDGLAVIPIAPERAKLYVPLEVVGYPYEFVYCIGKRHLYIAPLEYMGGSYSVSCFDRRTHERLWTSEPMLIPHISKMGLPPRFSIQIELVESGDRVAVFGSCGVSHLAVFRIADGRSIVRFSTALADPRFTPASAAAPIAAISFDDLKLESADDMHFTVEELPPKLAHLIGKEVRITGFMSPSPGEPRMSRFALRGDLVIPNRGGRYRDSIVVTMDGDTTVEYTLQPIEVEGRLGVSDIETPSGSRVSIFTIDEAQVVE